MVVFLNLFLEPVKISLGSEIDAKMTPNWSPNELFSFFFSVQLRKRKSVFGLRLCGPITHEALPWSAFFYPKMKETSGPAERNSQML